MKNLVNQLHHQNQLKKIIHHQQLNQRKRLQLLKMANLKVAMMMMMMKKKKTTMTRNLKKKKKKSQLLQLKTHERKFKIFSLLLLLL
jgi:hypothetical protein